MSSPLPPPVGPPISAAAAPRPARTSSRRPLVLAGLAAIAILGGGVGVWLATRSDSPSAASCLEGLPLPQRDTGDPLNLAFFIDFDAARRTGRLPDEYDTDAPTGEQARESFLVDGEFPYAPAAWNELLVQFRDEAPSFGVKDVRCILTDVQRRADVVRLTVDGEAEPTDARSVRVVEDFTVIELKKSDGPIELVEQPDAVQRAMDLAGSADAFGGIIIFEPVGDAAVVHALSERDGTTELTIVWVRPGIDDTELRDDVDFALAETAFYEDPDVDDVEVTVGDSTAVMVFDVGSDAREIRSVSGLRGGRLDDPLLGGLWIERN